MMQKFVNVVVLSGVAVGVISFGLFLFWEKITWGGKNPFQ